MWGELIGLGKSVPPTWCLVHAILRRIRHLQAYNAPLLILLYSYFDTTWQPIATHTLTSHLHTSVMALGQTYGVHESNISALQ
jgi:hypothetical protein